MAKTKPTYKDTKLGILEVREIEKITTEQVIETQIWIFKNYKKLPISETTIKKIHKKIAGKLFEEAGQFRKHEVTVGNYNPPEFFKISELMKNMVNDFKERRKYVKNIEDHIDLLPWFLHRFLWIHPFFDYNGRVIRLVGELYLLKNNLPVSSFRGISRNSFINAVKKATFEYDYSDLKKLLRKEIADVNRK